MNATRRSVMKAIGAAGLAAAGPAALAATAAPAAKISGPVKGGKGQLFGRFLGDMSAFGYVEEEYFIEGTAQRFKSQGEVRPDGMMSVIPTDSAPYRTRMIVRRPRDPRKFNGTVVVEWTNVTVGHEISTMGINRPSIYGDGYAYVAVSCQTVGLYGFAANPHGLKVWDPVRYDTLSIAGDSCSYDIFTQAAAALGPKRLYSGDNPLPGLNVRRVIATGASQSAARMRTYINAIQPQSRAFDGFLTLIDFGMGVGFEDAVLDRSVPSRAANFFRNPTRIRSDLSTPVFVVNSETETLAHFPSRQPDSATFRLWEIAGASHAPATSERIQNAMFERDGLAVNPPRNGSEVDWRPTADAALNHLDAWIRTGKAPPVQPRIEVSTDSAPHIVRDSLGIAKGGVRLPEVAVPIAINVGLIESSPALVLPGSSRPFDQARLKELYGNQARYAARVKVAADKAEKAGVIPRWRAAQYRAEAGRQVI